MIYFKIQDTLVIKATLAEIEGFTPIDTDKPYDYFCDHLYDIYYKDGEFIKIPNEHFYVEQKLDLKANKESSLNSIKVTTEAGNTFDGDEKSQDRMSKILLRSTLTDIAEIDWKLANNNIVTIKIEELKEALSLAIKEMSNIILKG